MNFGQAIEELKKGKKVARKGWNGKGMFIYLTFGSQCDEKILKKKINPHIDMKSSDDSIVIGWLASQTDMLSEDWYIVEL